ncbi:hypothetical protein C5B42_03645 [Candidatus Cerribacteria bacterium 'Amazon FNV 2010 28 9']|uniref:O-antigen ligase-related domain-containing protein n=1 Tax=Candidatus Cerribacteria bacterium 'Amazon FNV 2010 28 9' TaxID=2081795 RepID=A0A317JTH6_9BACT|nr:MAG: hypothetical protein C5B42_03645 [Candidatus Cerribacteria bacterium 'Amazon FNV 2010 28 9']
MNVSRFLNKLMFFLFGALFVLVPLLFTSVNDELFEFNKMLAVYVIALLMALVWAVRCITEKRLIWRRTVFDLPILLFLVSQVCATIFSMDVRTSLFGYYTRFNGGLFSLLSYAWMYEMFVIFISRDQVKKLLHILLFGGVLSAAYAFPEHFGHSPSCVLFSGSFDIKCWVQNVQDRVFGTFGQPNWLAAYLGMLIPLVIAQLFTPIKTKKSLLESDSLQRFLPQAICALVILLYTLTLLFTKSRSGIGALLLGLGLFGVEGIAAWSFAVRQHLHKKDTSIWTPIAVALTGIGIILCMMIVGSPFEFLNSFTTHLFPPKQIVSSSEAPPQPTVVSGDSQLDAGGSESGAIRAVVWKGAIDVWKRYPIFGSGVETFAYSYYKDRPKEHNLLSEWDFLYNKAHNEFLNFAATTGTFGLGTYLFMLSMFIAYPVWIAYKRLTISQTTADSQFTTILLLALSTSIVILSVSNFFGFSTVMVSALMYIFPGIAIVFVNEQKKLESEITIHEIDTNQWMMIGIAIIVTALPILYIHTLWNADVAYAKGKQYDAANLPQTAYAYLQQATTMLPGETTYHDEFSSNLATLAVALAQVGDSTSSAQLTTLAIQESNLTITQNPHNVGYYKTRIKVFLLLANLDPLYFTQAREATHTAIDLSPTDPKLVYFDALLADQAKDEQTYVADLQRAIDLKENYEDARYALGSYELKHEQPQQAADQFSYMLKNINPNNLLAQQGLASASALLQKKK